MAALRSLKTAIPSEKHQLCVSKNGGRSLEEVDGETFRSTVSQKA